MKLGERGRNFQNIGDIEINVYFSDTGTGFKGIGYAPRVTCAMSVNIDIRGGGVMPTFTTSRMSLYLSYTGVFVFRGTHFMNLKDVHRESDRGGKLVSKFLYMKHE